MDVEDEDDGVFERVSSSNNQVSFLDEPTNGGISGFGDDDGDFDDGPTISLTSTVDPANWPPKTSPIEPLQLPYGNPTPPPDRMCIFERPEKIKEGKEKNILHYNIQLPSDFKMKSKVERRPDQGDTVDLTGDGEPSSSSSLSSSSLSAADATSVLQPGKVGKVQIMKSGKTRIVLDDGRKYTLARGLRTSFQEFIMYMDFKSERQAGTGEAAAAETAAGEATRARRSNRSDSSSAPPVRVKVEGETPPLEKLEKDKTGSFYFALGVKNGERFVAIREDL